MCTLPAPPPSKKNIQLCLPYLHQTGHISAQCLLGVHCCGGDFSSFSYYIFIFQRIPRAAVAHGEETAKCYPFVSCTSKQSTLTKFETFEIMYRDTNLVLTSEAP